MASGLAWGQEGAGHTVQRLNLIDIQRRSGPGVRMAWDKGERGMTSEALWSLSGYLKCWDRWGHEDQECNCPVGEARDCIEEHLGSKPRQTG